MFTKIKLIPIHRFTFAIVCSLLLVLSILTTYQTVKTKHQEVITAAKLTQNDLLIASLSARAKSLQANYNSIKNDDSHQKLDTINQVIDKYNVVKNKSVTYKSQGVDTGSIDSQFPTVVAEILEAKYSEADSLLTSLDNNLEANLKQKQAADAAAAKKPVVTTTCSSIPASGYCRVTVNGFTVDVITASLSSTSVVTDTGNSEDCLNNCPVKSLLNYVKDNGGYAGINGTYFCPPDYSNCSERVNSYDFPVYNSNLKKWINFGNILWDNRAMLAFTSSGAVFYPQASSYSSLLGIKAAIVNSPGLVYNSANIVGNYTLTSSQTTKGYRGGVAVKGNTIYLVITRSATVSDLAGIMTALGVTHAINIDGGGSSAMYFNGSYKIGPGRSLPNALILK